MSDGPKKRILRLSAGVLLGVFILAGVIWLLILTVGNHEPLYAGRSAAGWREQLAGHDAGASNQASEVLNRQIIPRLVDQMFHDTNDSKIRLSLIQIFNGLPGIHINFSEASVRRTEAAGDLGYFGPPAKAAIPSLIQALKGPEVQLHGSAMQALGDIHSEPDVVIPLLIPYLTNGLLNAEAATALGNYGSLAREAVPIMVPLLHVRDKETRFAANIALKKIDPVAAGKAGVK